MKPHNTQKEQLNPATTIALKIAKNCLTLLALQAICLCAWGQYKVSGIVSDSKGAPLPGATVKLSGTLIGTITSGNGAYILNLPNDTGVLVYSEIGFETKTENISGRSSINIILESSLSKLNSVVVIGYGTQSENLITSAISKIDTMVFKNVPYANAAYGLQGTIPGLRVTTNSGQPGASPVIILRGGTELNPDASVPLYVIDGVISPDLTGINPSDIKTITVLKDAAATAIYGARGSNGVIIVTTKTGQPGRTRITYNANLEFSHYDPRIKMLNAKQFVYYNRLAIQASLINEPFFAPILTAPTSAGTGNDLTHNTFYTTQYLTSQNAYLLKDGWQSEPDPLDKSKTLIFKNTDWRNLIFRTAVSSDHNISASGGTDKATYSLSLGYLNNSGVAINTGYNRLTLNTRESFKINDKLRVFSQVLYSNGATKGVNSESNIFGRLLQTAPTEKYKFLDGTLAPGPSSSKSNPVYQMSVIHGGNTEIKSTYSLGAEWDILPGLSFKPQVSQLTMTTDSRQFIQSNYSGTHLDVTRPSEENYHKFLQYQADAIFDYNKSFANRHNLDITAGTSYISTENDALGASGQGAATDLIPTLNASAVPVGVNSSQDYLVYAGYFARIDYNYEQKYMISLSSRYDGASNLGAKYKWGLFPGVSIGWNLNKESFWNPLLHAVPNLKLRASYGVNGNVNGIGPYQAQGEYSVGAIYGGTSAIQSTVLANPNLRWEQAKTLDFGIDLGLLDNRINYTMDIYRRITSNEIANQSLPEYTGFASILTNLGTLQNKGIELTLDLNILPPSSAFQWNLSFNAAYVTDKILELPNNGVPKNRIGGVYIWDPKANNYEWEGGLQEGGTMGNLYGYKEIGLYQSDSAAAKGPYDQLVVASDRRKFAGDVIWLDSDHNDTIDSRDQVYMGNQYPKWTGGIISTFSYKNFYLTIRADFMTGQTIYDYVLATTTGQFAGELGLSSLVANSWLTPGQKTDIPRLYYGDYQENLLRGNSIMFQKGNYLAIRELTLSYEVPNKFLNKYKINSLRLNATAHNLHYFTHYLGMNPETDSGTDYGYYPISSDFVFGLTISL